MIPWPFVILLFMGMAIHIALGLYSRQFKNQPVQLPFEILMYICAVWCATFMLDISNESLAFKIMMMQVRFLFLPFIALTLMLIALFFSGHRSWLTTRRLSLLLIIPVVTVVLALATHYSTLFRFNYSLIETSAGFSVLGFTNGPWSAYIYNPYTYILEFITFLLLLQVIFGSQKLYARQAILFFVAILIPVILDILFTLGISPVQGYNMVPSTFAFTGILLAIALFEYRFIDIMPIARTTLFEQMTDPMLVIDPDGRLVDINPSAEQVLGLSRTENTGRNVLDALAGYPEIRSCIESSSATCGPIEIRREPPNRIFEIVIQEMGSGRGIPPAKLVMMRDVSDRVHAEARSVHLASFPELTPVLILEADLNGSILYTNPSCLHTLEAIGEKDPAIFIPPEVHDRLNGVEITESHHEVREINLHNRVFRENIYFTPEFASVRIYATDITDRKQAEDTLRETAGYLKKLIDYASAPIIVWDPDFRVTRFNHAFETLTHRCEQDVLGRSLAILFPDETRDSSLALIKQTIDGGQLESIKIPIFSLDGTIHTVLWNSANIMSPNGDLISTIAQGIDITRSEITEETLRNSEERFRTAFDDAAIPMSMTSIDGRLIRVNHAFCSLLGYSAEELLTKSFADITYPDDLDQSLNKVNEAVSGKTRTLIFEKRYVRKDGALVLTHVSSMLLKDPAGKPLYFITHIQDITERKRAEEALRESEERYREFFTTSRDAVFITSPQGQWIDFNDTALEMFGFSNRTELMATPLTDLYEHPQQRGDLLRLIEREGYVKEYEVRLKKKDGTIIDTVITAVPLRKPDGTIKAFTGTIRDITELKRAELLLRQSEEKFRETVKLLDEGFYSVTPDGVLLEHNIAFNRILGFESSKDLAGMQTPDFWEDPGERKEYLDTLMSKGSIQNYVINAKTVLGEHIVVLANSHLVRDENARLVRIDGTVTDFTERKRAEEDLRESEEKFATAFKTSPYAITITRATDGSFIDVNDAFTQITGYTHEEAVIGSSIGLDLWVNLEDRNRVIVALHEGRNVIGQEFLFRRKDGSIITGLFSAQIIILNKVPCILSSISDISDRKDAEERLQQSEFRFRSLIQNSSDMIRIIGSDGLIVYGSDSTERILGYSPESLLGTNPFDLIHPDDLDNVRTDLMQVYEKTNPGTPTEFRIRKADGEYIWVDSVGINLLDVPAVNGIVVTTRPIQQRKLAEEALRESETRFRTMADWTYDWEYWVDNQKNVVYMSPSVERITGYPAQDFIADRNHIDRIIYPDDRAIWDSHVPLHTHVTKADDPVEIEFRIISHDGAIRWISHICRTICSDNHTCVGRRVSNRDITERKIAEEQLKASNERFNNVAHATNDIVWDWDLTSNHLWWNEAIYSAFGYRHDEIEPTIESWYTRLHPDDRDKMISGIHAVIDGGGQNWSEEYRFRKADSSYAYIYDRGFVMRDTNGTAVRMLGAMLDVTERRRSEELLRETNEYLNSLFNYANAPIITWDPEFRITRFNHSFEHLSGMSQEDVLGKNLDILFPEETRAASRSLINKTLDGERWETVEIPILHADGNTHSVLWNSANVLDRDGKIIATIAQGMDITEQKKALERIRWLASFPELNPNPVIEMTAEGEITFVNAVTKSTLLGLGLPDNPALFIPGDKDELLRLLRETDELQVYREITLLTETFAENISLNRALQVLRFYTMNITEQKRAERERERLFIDLEQKNAELERFTYTASHDLKTPLITIRGFLGFVERDAQAGDMTRLRQDLARIGNAATRMQELLDSLLELSRISRIIELPEPVSLEELSEEAAELLAVPIHERNVTLTIATDLPDVYGDKKRLREVMINLIENGVKFMGGQTAPKVEIGVRYEAGNPVFFVRDNGIGIPPEYQGRLFTLFERIEVNMPGTGVGLALVKRIIEIHGGKVWVESEGSGKGSTFCFTLPGVPEHWDIDHEEEQ